MGLAIAAALDSMAFIVTRLALIVARMKRPVLKMARVTKDVILVALGPFASKIVPQAASSNVIQILVNVMTVTLVFGEILYAICSVLRPV
jgi:hypothetical protein